MQCIHRAWTGTNCHPHCSVGREGCSGIGMLSDEQFLLLFLSHGINSLSQAHPQILSLNETGHWNTDKSSSIEQKGPCYWGFSG